MKIQTEQICAYFNWFKRLVTNYNNTDTVHMTVWLKEFLGN